MPVATQADCSRLIRSMVRVRASVPADAFTASILGTERSGSGIAIGPEGLILTIGYLITEASDVVLTTHDGRDLHGHGLAYDQVTGFGLVRPLGPLDAKPLTLGDGAALDLGQELHVLSHPQLAPPLPVTVIALREFAGAWEYLLERAIFTSPAHPHWSGAALVDHHGELVGVGSLMVRESNGGDTTDANMFVPTDLLKPVLEDLRSAGRAARPPRPWLGVYLADVKGSVLVAGVVDEGPAQNADLREGDLIREVAGQEVDSIAAFYRILWHQREAGSIIKLTVTRGGKPAYVLVRSVDRNSLLKKPRPH